MSLPVLWFYFWYSSDAFHHYYYSKVVHTQTNQHKKSSINYYYHTVNYFFFFSLLFLECVCACVRACVRVCACVCACMHVIFGYVTTWILTWQPKSTRVSQFTYTLHQHNFAQQHNYYKCHQNKQILSTYPPPPLPFLQIHKTTNDMKKLKSSDDVPVITLLNF